MTSKSLQVFWRGEVVGAVCKSEPDNLRLYGGWDPLQTAHASLFAETLLDGEEEVRVTIGEKHPELKGVVPFAPDDWIEIHLM